MYYCSICKIGEMLPGSTMVTLEWGKSIILVKNVPAMVCNNCANYFLESKTARAVLEKAASPIQKGAKIEVVSLQAA